MTMESQSYYPNLYEAFSEQNIRDPHRIGLTPRLDSKVPVPYFGWYDFYLMMPVQEKPYFDRRDEGLGHASVFIR